MINDRDIEFMQRAMVLAKCGLGWVNPNPLVGAVIVKHGRIIGEGWHERYGEFHAERNALKNATEDVSGATMYVTLEPCCHTGKQPPCTEALIESGIRKVYVGMLDPNPLVAGKGIDILRRSGIEVETGFEQSELERMNRVFLKYITTRMPWTVLKSAMTLDGKIATHTGDSRWVSSEISREEVHKMRSQYSAIMVGIGTVIADDPMLTNRIDPTQRQPVRVVVDSRCMISLDSKIVNSADRFRTIIAHTNKADRANIEALNKSGVETLMCDEQDCMVDVRNMMMRLGEKKIDSVLVEGGGKLNYSMIEAGLADEYYCYIAPKIVGGSDSPTSVGGKGFELMKDAVKLKDITVGRSGDDIRIHGLFCKDK